MDFGDKSLPLDESEDKFSFVEPLSVGHSGSISSSRLTKLVDELSRNAWGCDLILSLFNAALCSYRSDRCLRPFPPFYINNEEKDFNALRITCDSIPPLKVLLKESNKCSEEIVQLLSWLFLEKGQPVLKRISLRSVSFPSSLSKIYEPHYLFEVLNQDKIEAVWQKRRGDREVILAYHGSTVDNFYSILKVGLQQHFSIEKEVLFGNGIYLSNEVSVSAHYAPFGQTWKNSALGAKHSVIAICEVINDLNKVKYSRKKGRSLNRGGLEEIPEKYFVVTDSDMVRVKYLMVYREKTDFSVKNYIVNNLFVIILIMYFFLIVTVGLFNNGSFTKLGKWFSKMLK